MIPKEIRSLHRVQQAKASSLFTAIIPEVTSSIRERATSYVRRYMESKGPCYRRYNPPAPPPFSQAPSSHHRHNHQWQIPLLQLCPTLSSYPSPYGLSLMVCICIGAFMGFASLSSPLFSLAGTARQAHKMLVARVFRPWWRLPVGVVLSLSVPPCFYRFCNMT